MSLGIAGYVVHARTTPAEERDALRTALLARPIQGGILIATCQRVEVHGPRPAVQAAAARHPARGARLLTDAAAARHLLGVATGLDSTVIGEDQVLHQVRGAARAARAAGPLHPAVDRLVDVALRTGRRTRSWLPAARPSLADLALDRVRVRELVDAEPAFGGGRPILVVGAGAMGRLAALAARARGASVIVASRDPGRARTLADRVGGGTSLLDPGVAALSGVAGVIVALSGPWLLEPATATALARVVPWVIDLSAPPAVPPGVRAALGGRLLTVDALSAAGPVGPPELIGRLEAATDAALAELLAWAAGSDGRDVARRLADRAARARDAELAVLWGELPALDAVHRAAIARMTEKLSDRLLAAPLDGLETDAAGTRPEVVRAAFRL